MKYEEYITQLGFSENELKILSQIHERCEEEFSEEFSRARAEYDKGDEAFEKYLNAFADKSGIHINTLNLYIYMRFLEDTYAEYKKLGVGDDIFLRTMSGFSVASRMTNENGLAFGVQQPVYRQWYRREIGAVIFAIGLLRFEIVKAPCYMEVDGKSIKEGESCISVHIPRFVKWDNEACEETYAEARNFFKKFFGMNDVFFICRSWLLYPWLEDVLPENSKILDFKRKYKIVEVMENNLGMKWIFNWGIGSGDEVNYEELPEDTSLRRAAKARLLSGKNIGTAMGVRL